MSGMDPAVRRRGSGGRQRRSRGHFLMIGGSFLVALRALLRWARFMQQIGGLGSDIDRTDKTPRERENVARERDDDGDRLLFGPILMQRDLPARLLVRVVQTGMAAT
jgi:hypothetical protein